MTTQFVAQIQPNPAPARLPYGAGDTDDGYTLVFANLDAFNKWRAHEEETNVVEFVKGDTHCSKAVPPRFKDHTKLVCARHSRSGRKKYVKKHPERIRKVPSRKLEGQGCPASISFKTYFDTDEVRACYNSQHSHEIGPANFPFTRRGRKAKAQQEGRKTQKTNDTVHTISTSSSNPANGIANTSQSSIASTPRPGPLSFSAAISMIAPLPDAYTLSPSSSSHLHVHQHYPTPDPHSPSISVPQERWERMSVLYNSIREHAREFKYPGPSVAALESILIRLYLESPIGTATIPSSNAIGGGMLTPRSQGYNVTNEFAPREDSRHSEACS